MLGYRPAQESDRSWVWKIKKLCLADYVRQTFGDWNDQVQQARFEASFNTQEIQIISQDEKAVGYIAVADGESEIRLYNIMIAPEFQNRGLGTEAIKDLLDEARKKSLPVRLQVLKVNPARNLYTRLGFKVTGETDTHYQMSWLA